MSNPIGLIWDSNSKFEIVRIRARLAQNTIDLPNLPIDDTCEDEKQAARRAGLAFEVALIQSAQSAVVDAPGEGVCSCSPLRSPCRIRVRSAGWLR